MASDEIFERAHALGATATELMRASGLDGLAVVTKKHFHLYPYYLATSSNFGYGWDNFAAYQRYMRQAREAELQSLYASRIQGRSVEEQLAKLEKENRKHHAYGSEFRQEFHPQFVRDTKSGLVVVIEADDYPNGDALQLLRKVATDVDKVSPVFTEAAGLVRATLTNLEGSLPDTSVAVAMLALTQLAIKNKFSEPAIVCGMASAKIADVTVSNWAIVAAKALSTSMTNQSSGPVTGDIVGAKIVAGRCGNRVAAAGGLPTGEEDIVAINKAFQI